jgi:hypothetical protein
MGSRREARHAGMRHAAAATDSNIAMTDKNTAGSSGRMPYSMEQINCAATMLPTA